jgi:integrase
LPQAAEPRPLASRRGFQAVPTDPEFWNALRAAGGRGRHDPHRIASLIAVYRGSPETAHWRPATRRDYEIYLRRIESDWGTLDVGDITRAAVYALRDGMRETPVAANHLISILRGFLEWCAARGEVAANPARGIKPLRIDDDGAKPWPEHAYQFVLAHAPEDLRRMAVLGRATGQRRSDLVRMRPQDRRDGGIDVLVGKRRDKPHWVPLTSAFAAEIDGLSVLVMTPYLLSPAGRRYTGDHLNSRWNRWRASAAAKPIAGMELTIHGLRATAVVDRRLAGLNPQEIAAQLCMSLPMVMRYSRFADQEALARAGMARLEERREK